jgi:anti-sigma B factor antagonist
VSLNIKEEIKTPWTILHLNGKLDVITSAMLDEALYKCFHEGKSHIAIDFSHLVYLSSSGIRVLLSQTKKFFEQKRRFALYALPEHIMEIIRLAGFDKVFVIAKEFKDLK